MIYTYSILELANHPGSRINNHPGTREAENVKKLPGQPGTRYLMLDKLNVT